MTEEQFYFECWFNCYTNQIDGYAFGAPQRQNFKPIIPFKKNRDGTYNRAGTLELPAFTFTNEQKQKLLVVTP